METLKPKYQLIEPDERNLYFIHSESECEAKRLSIDNVYEEVEKITLSQNVPEHVKNHFQQARHLAIYSWFNYPFNVTAQLMSFVSVEFALKDRIKPEKYMPFKKMVATAVERKWVVDEGFAITKFREKSDKSYVETLVDVMPNLRNKLAHGSSMLHNNSLSSLRICADFINQLYKN